MRMILSEILIIFDATLTIIKSLSTNFSITNLFLDDDDSLITSTDVADLSKEFLFDESLLLLSSNNIFGADDSNRHDRVDDILVNVTSSSCATQQLVNREISTTDGLIFNMHTHFFRSRDDPSSLSFRFPSTLFFY